MTQITNLLIKKPLLSIVVFLVCFFSFPSTASFFNSFNLFNSAANASIIVGRCSQTGYVENHFGCSMESSFGAAASRWRTDPLDVEDCLEGYQTDDTICSGTSTNLCGEGIRNCCVPCRRVDSAESREHGEACENTEQCSADERLVCREGLCLRPVASVSEGLTCMRTDECLQLTPQGQGLRCENQSCRAIPNCTSDSQCQDSLGTPRAICVDAIAGCRVVGCESNEQCISELNDSNAICDNQTGNCVINDNEIVTRPPTPGNPFEICNQVDSESKGACDNCLDGTTLGGEEGLWTSIGCVPSEGDGMIRHFIVLGLGLAGGVGLLMIIAAGAMFTLSRNDPKKVGDAKELLTSVVIGLVFIAFSVTVLQFIGITILRIPGFGGP